MTPKRKTVDKKLSKRVNFIINTAGWFMIGLCLSRVYNNTETTGTLFLLVAAILAINTEFRIHD